MEELGLQPGTRRAPYEYVLWFRTQVRYWPKTVESIDALVSAFFANDPYYPRPRPSNRL